MSRKTKEQLEAEIAPLQAALQKLREEEQRKENLHLVGKCFKYRNSYSSPQKPGDYWWLYVKVTGVEHSWPRTFTFEIDKNGAIDIKVDSLRPTLSTGYVPISSKEFNAAWGRLQKRVASLKP